MATAAARDAATEHPGIFRRIQELLGVSRLTSEQDLARLVERGVSPQAVESLRRHGLKDDEVYAFLLPRRTLAHRRLRREALSRDESDRVVRLARIAAFCEQVFGEPARAWRWLREGKRQFQGRSPLELSSTDAGARVVEAWLYRIDEGMAAQVILWRISNHQSLTGEGALRASGRWHTRGRRVVYCAQTPSSALLEILVHAELGVGDLPARYKLLKIDAPDDIRVERVSVADLQADWIEHIDASRAVGDAWLTGRRSALLFVPSAVIPATDNILVNPAHLDAGRLVITQVTDHIIDPRLLR